MGSTPADTEREISQLRGDMTAALDELERRLRGGLRGIAGAEARVTSARTREEVVERATQNPTLLGVAGVVAAGAITYGSWSLVKRLRDRDKPQNRIKREVKHVRSELGGKVSERFERTRRELERARQRAVLVKLEPADRGYMRVTDARVESLNKKRGKRSVIKKLIWAGLLSVFMAVASVLARRVADTVWRAMTHEDPPTAKSSAASS